MKQTYEEYLTEHHGEFNVYKFRLSNGHEVYLSEREQEELIDKLDISHKINDALEESELDIKENLKGGLLIEAKQILEDIQMESIFINIDIDLIIERLEKIL